MNDTGNEQTIEELLELLKDRKWRIREDAVDALIRRGKDAVVPLLHALEEGHRNRFDIAQALGGIGDSRAVEPLIQELDTANFFVTQAAAKALGNIGDSRAIAPLIDVFRMRWDDTEAITTWQTAAFALAAFGRPALLPLLSALDDEDENVRLWSTEALGKLVDPDAIDPLIHMLQDKRPIVRAHAVVALGNIGDSRAMDALTSLLQDEDGYVRHRVLYAISQIGGPALFDVLVRGLRDPEARVRRAAVVGIGKIATPQAMEVLITTLNDPADEVRIVAANALGKIGDEHALAALEQIQHDSERTNVKKVRDAIQSAIESIVVRLQQDE